MYISIRKKVSIFLALLLVFSSCNFSIFADGISTSSNILLDEVLDDTFVSTDSEIIIDSEDENYTVEAEEDEATHSDVVADEEEIKENEIVENDNKANESETEYIINESDTQQNVATSSIIDEVVEKEEIATISEVVDIDVEDVNGFIKPNYTPSKVVKKLRNGLFGAPNLQDRYDGRVETNEAGYPLLPEIRNQGSEGLCWAFSTIGMIEVSLRKQGIINTDADDARSNLSEMVLGYYTLKGLKRATADGSNGLDTPGIEGNDYTLNKTTNVGGNQLEATLMMSSFMGPVIENEDTEYSKFNAVYNSNADNNIDDKYAFNSNDYVIKDVNFVIKTDIDTIKQLILKNGSAGINYRSQSNNPGGLHRCDYEGVDDEYFYYSKNTADPQPTHAVMIVGWDDNVPKEYFFTGSSYDTATYMATDDGAWLLRNSWGPNAYSDREGYFWLSYTDPSIDDTIYSIEAMEVDNYKYNYHYDTTGFAAWDDGNDTTSHFTLTESKFANIFKVTDDFNQTLDAVNIASYEAGARFRIEIYTKNTIMLDPTTGATKKLSQEVTFDTGGIFTVELNNKIDIPKGTYYSVVLYPLNNHGKIMVDCDHADSSREYKNESHYGQSFVGRSYNTEWRDMRDIYGGENVNLRIKGLTNPKVLDLTYDITYNLNGGSWNNYTPVISRSFYEGLKLPTADNIKKEGYLFTGWYDNASFTGSAITSISANVEGPHNFYAKWRSTTHTIKFDANGGKGTMADIKVEDGGSVTLPRCSFTLKGYNFSNWDRHGTSGAFTNGATIHDITEDILLIARWKSSSSGVPISGGGSSGSSGGGGGGGGGGGSSSGGGGGISSAGASGGGPGEMIATTNTEDSLTNNLANTETMLATQAVDNTVRSISILTPMAQVSVNYNTNGSTWTKDANGNWHLNIIGSNGITSEQKNGFAAVSTEMTGADGKKTMVQDIYYFDATGNMYTGWLQDSTGATYYFETAGSYMGRMSKGWALVSGTYYYFNSDGAMLRDATTPDGYKVDAEGKWQK